MRESRIDPAGGDPELAGLRSAAEAGDIADVVSTLRRFTGYDLSALVSGMSVLTALDDALPDLVTRSPDDPLPRLLLGARTINRAWSEWNVARASLVSQEQIDRFHAQMDEAEEHLHEAARLDRGSSAPWYFLLISGHGLGEGGPEASLRRFEAVTSRDPGHFGAHWQRLQQLCEKWGGSHEQMHAFAREAMLGSDEPSMGVLVAQAHIEQWLDLGGGEPGRAYLSTLTVRESLLDAARRSIGRADYAPAREPYLGYNVFACAFSLAGLLQAADRAFARTHGVVTTAPWEYVAMAPLNGYLRWRYISHKKR